MRTDGGFKKLPEKQHERKRKRRAGWNRRQGERERKSEKGEEMDERIGSQEIDREREKNGKWKERVFNYKNACIAPWLQTKNPQEFQME